MVLTVHFSEHSPNNNVKKLFLILFCCSFGNLFYFYMKLKPHTHINIGN